MLALRSITAVVNRQQQADGVMQYLNKHHQHIDSVQLKSRAVLSALPTNLQLRSLQLDWVRLQLQPGDGFHGVLGAAGTALKQLRLSECTLVGDVGANVLSHLPAGLEHLSISELRLSASPESLQTQKLVFQTGVLQTLQQLTHLELALIKLQGPDRVANAVQPLQALNGLVDLRLAGMCRRLDESDSPLIVTASILSSMPLLTRLDLDKCDLEDGIMAGKTRLQHLSLVRCDSSDGAAGVSELFSHLHHLQQLTTLCLAQSFWVVEEGSPPAAAYSALTASSKLVELILTEIKLPEGAWEHVFPAGKQVPHLKTLDVSWPQQLDGNDEFVPEGSRLVSCCPGLQALNIVGPCYTAELLAALTGLSGLHTLHLHLCGPAEEGLQRVCQLEGLRELLVTTNDHFPDNKGLLLQLTQLKQLTSLTARHAGQTVILKSEVGSQHWVAFIPCCVLALGQFDPRQLPELLVFNTSCCYIFTYVRVKS